MLRGERRVWSGTSTYRDPVEALLEVSFSFSLLYVLYRGVYRACGVPAYQSAQRGHLFLARCFARRGSGISRAGYIKSSPNSLFVLQISNTEEILTSCSLPSKSKEEKKDPHLCPRVGGTMKFSVGLGSRKRSPEFPCVSRLRQRRLLSLLMRQELYNTFDALVGESDAFMYPEHLTELVKAGRWEEAIAYLSRFLPSDRLLSVHGRALLHFLRVHKAIHAIVDGAPETQAVNAALNMCFSMGFVHSEGMTKLRAMLWSLICYRGARDSLDLGRVRDKAATIIEDLIFETPELKEYRTYARGPMKPHNVLPVGFGFRARRHVKRGPVPASVLVNHYLRKRRMLPSSTSCHCEELSSASLIKAKGWMVDLVDTSLKAGKRNLGCALKPVSNKGAPIGPVSQTNLGTFKSPATHSDMSWDTNLDLMAREWAIYLSDDRLEAWPDLSQGYPPIRRSVHKDVFQVSLTIPDTLTRSAKSSTISSFTKAGALPSEVMPATWASFSENSLISTVTNTGTHKHLSREHCYTENACQSFCPRKNPRMELTTTVGQALNPKRQRSILASLMEGC
uniref:Uncharacterized protein n=1 Tax=Avena sativa TaxID=4498 RepID=A0ACD5WAI9_AVESA